MLSDRVYTRLSMAMPAGALRAVGRFHVPIYRLTRGRLLASLDGAPLLLLTTTGRRSGLPRTAPVVYLPDGERMIVIGSNAGNVRPPAWALNLEASPEAEVEVGGRRVPVDARIATGEEREELWRKMTAQYSGFDDYAANTSRDIRLFVLVPRVSRPRARAAGAGSPPRPR